MRTVTEEAVKRLVKFKGECCKTCHKEYEEKGYEFIQIYLGKDRDALVCCKVVDAVEEYKRNKLNHEKSIKFN